MRNRVSFKSMSVLTASFLLSSAVVAVEEIPAWVDGPEAVESIPDDGNNYAPGSAAKRVVDKSAKRKHRPLTVAEIEQMKQRRGMVGTATSDDIDQSHRIEVMPGVVANVRAKIETAGTARVIVTMRPPLNAIDEREEAMQAIPSVSQVVNNAGGEVLQAFSHLPVLVINANDSVIDELLQLDSVGGVELDWQGKANLESTIPLIGADILTAHSTDGAGYEGETGNWSVAVLDNGFRTSHVALEGRVKQESCFVIDASCPNNTNSQVGAGASSDGCGTLSQCDHGTHVAGIAVGNFTNSDLLLNDGVAPGAGLYAIDIFEADESFYGSSMVAAMNHIYAEVEGGAKISAVNLSIGTYETFGYACDSIYPSSTTAVDALVSIGVAVVAASGNASSTTGVSLPACISQVVAVGSTNDADVVSSFTNSSELIDLWAPGTDIQSAGYLSNTELVTFSGTSMAAPHVSGAYAALSECWQGGVESRPENFLSYFQSTGLPVSRGSLIRSRLDILAAADEFVDDDFSERLTISGVNGLDGYYTMCTTSEPMEPMHRPSYEGVFEPSTGGTWYTFVVPEDGVYEFDTCDVATTFDTVLAAYTGSEIQSLKRIAADDDGCATGSGSRIAIQGIAGQEVHVNVSGYGEPGNLGSTGIYKMAWNQTSTELVYCDGKLATILGTNGSDVIVGSAMADVIASGGGDDRVFALAGNDTVCLGDGTDWAKGGPGYDVMLGGSGDDLLKGGANSDKLHGGDGNDFIEGGDRSDRLYGDDGDDVMFGNEFSDLIYGGRGNDLIYAGTGNDRLFGQGGADEIKGDDGNDKIYGGQGNDDLSGNDGNDRIWGQTGHDRIYGDAGDDSWLDGGDHNDIIFGGGGDDTIRGGDGRDRVYGQGGADDVRAQAGNDLVTDGGPGNDSCQVAPGVDVAAINCE